MSEANLTTDSMFVDIPLGQIFADDEFNCRGKINPIDVYELAQDIQRKGLINPVLIEPCNEADKLKSGGRPYKLLAGYRRLMAHGVAKLATIKCQLLKKTLDASEALFVNLSENAQRQELNIMQEAKTIARLIELGHARDYIASRTGQSQGWVQVRTMLLELPEEVQKEAEVGMIGQSQIRELYSVFKKYGKEALFKATKLCKDAIIAGKKNVSVNPNRVDPNKKTLRKKGEVMKMMDHIRENIGGGLHLRCMAWCCGEISTQELYEGIRTIAEAKGLEYKIPSNPILEGDINTALQDLVES